MNFSLYTPVAFSQNLLLNKPKRVFYQNLAVVLIRTTKGVFAYEDFCPHRGLALSEGRVVDGQIQCKYHGWRFRCENGDVDFVPVKNLSAKCKLKSFFALESYQLIWMSPSIKAVLPELSNSFPSITLCGTIKAKQIHTLENFLEGSHTHYVHDGLIRSQNKKRYPIKAKIIKMDFGFRVHYESEPAKGFLTKMLPKRLQQLNAVSTYIHPGIAVLEFFNPLQQMVSRFEAILIQENQEVKYFARIFLNLGWLTPIFTPLAKIFFKKIIDQDKRILELQEQNLIGFKNRTFFIDETDMVGKYLYAWNQEQIDHLPNEVIFNVFW